MPASLLFFFFLEASFPSCLAWASASCFLSRSLSLTGIATLCDSACCVFWEDVKLGASSWPVTQEPLIFVISSQRWVLCLCYKISCSPITCYCVLEDWVISFFFSRAAVFISQLMLIFVSSVFALFLSTAVFCTASLQKKNPISERIMYSATFHHD